MGNKNFIMLSTEINSDMLIQALPSALYTPFLGGGKIIQVEIIIIQW